MLPSGSLARLAAGSSKISGCCCKTVVTQSSLHRKEIPKNSKGKRNRCQAIWHRGIITSQKYLLEVLKSSLETEKPRLFAEYNQQDAKFHNLFL